MGFKRTGIRTTKKVLRFIIKMLQFIFSFILGILAGTLTGLIPGIHTNLISIIILSISTLLFPSINVTLLIIFIVSMNITHTFLDFIPSIFLGCPDTDTELSILPGHRLLKKGLGYQAVILSVYGSIFAIFILFLILIPSIFFLPIINNKIQFFIPYFLILTTIILILTESHKIKSLIIFSISGILGIATLNHSQINQPLLPILTGLFGSSTLILSIKNKVNIPEQKISTPKTNPTKPLLASLISAPLCSFLPGLGSGQAAIIANTIIKTTQKEFLILLGAINTLVMGFSFIAFYSISKTRTGATVAIQEIIGQPSNHTLKIILITIFFSSILAFFITKILAKIIAQKITKLNYTILSLLTLLLLTNIILIVSKFPGLFIFIISTLLGILCIKLKVRRTQMMGCLLMPTIIWYLG